MDLNLLSLFVLVADASSFAAVAEKLGLRRSSVSRGVASLERALGVQLFNRTTRHVALTTAGTALYAKVAPQLALLKEAVGSLPEREPMPSGELRLTVPTDIGVTVLPPLLAGFSLRYPEVRLDVRLSHQQVDLVADGFDAALRVGAKLSDSSLVARKLTEMRMQVYASPTYLARDGTPRTLREASEHPWVWLTGRPLPRPLLPPSPELRVRGDDISFLLRMVVAGAGLGALPTFLVRDELASGTLVRVLPKVSISVGALHFVHPATRHVPRKVSALRDYLAEHFERYPLAG